MTRFCKAGKGPEYNLMGKEAITKALNDAGIEYSSIDGAVAGYCYGDAGSGQRCFYEVGLTGIPVFNTSNNCSTASCALLLARMMVLSGIHHCVLALGFESMKNGLNQPFTDSGWPSPLEKHFEYMHDCGSTKESLGRGNLMTENVIKMFGDAASEHQRSFGTTPEQFAKVAWKNHKHSVNNPYALNQKVYTMEQILDPRTQLYGPLTLYQACPTADGAACAILCSKQFLERSRSKGVKAVEILAQRLVSDLPSSFDVENKSFANLCGFSMARKAAEQIYKDANIQPTNVDVLEVHDCFSSSELMICEALGLCPIGSSGAMVDSGRWIQNKDGGELYQYGGRWVVNPSGGLESKGHPIGATGLGQCAELIWQLRGEAGKRQVEGAQVALQHNFGLGSAAVLTLYRKYGGECGEGVSRITSKL
eukprot:TRINITY_DN4884_c0_g1_i2.p1 TRINITY_DN4884_c0_g1~~TRINITY_DN4884_c0_g1_i2.p1  ORF type:complete len:422 (-),score=72.63 TRINITY_DN4884_c0_g1_i2:143-1408(-)